MLLVNRAAEDGVIAVEDHRGPVAVMDVAVEDRGAANPAIALERADGDRDVVEQTESFAVIREGVMEAAAQVERGAHVQRRRGGGTGAAHHQTEPVGNAGPPRQLQRRDLVRGQTVVANLLEVFSRVDERQIVPGGERRLEDLTASETRIAEQALGDQSVLRSGPDVPRQRDLVSR